MSLTLLLKFCLLQLYNLDNLSVFAVILIKRKIGVDFHISPILFFCCKSVQGGCMSFPLNDNFSHRTQAYLLASFRIISSVH